MNPDLDRLQPYPFERLARLKADVMPPSDRDHIALSIGEPRQPTPALITDEVISHLHGLSSYPTTRGTPALRESVAAWLCTRFRLAAGSIDPERHILPVNGTREALFAFAQAMLDGSKTPRVLMPNPFYQIYEGAALLAGGQPWYVPCDTDSEFLPDFDTVPAEVWEQTQLVYLCSPGNPTGAVMDNAALQRLLERADHYDFILAADECYSEIYADESRPPAGLLQAAAAAGRTDYRRCMVFHSLSKRSNAPGLRSGFVAGDADLIERFFLYRTYHGCAMPLPTQAASIRAWADEAHVRANRDSYREKFAAVLDILPPSLNAVRPQGGFYLWPETPIDDEQFARDLYAQQNVTVLPGSYLSREANGANPGHKRVRMALVAPLDECIDAARRIARFVATL